MKQKHGPSETRFLQVWWSVLQHVHVFEWCGDARRVWPPSSSFPHISLKPRQHFSEVTEMSGQASAQTAPLLAPEHGGWVSVNVIQQRTLLVAWRGRGGTYPAMWVVVYPLWGQKQLSPVIWLDMHSACGGDYERFGHVRFKFSTCHGRSFVRVSLQCLLKRLCWPDLVWVFHLSPRHRFLSTTVPRSCQDCIAWVWGGRGEKMT